jgi:Ca-activated chloride channel family protein
LGSDHFIEEIKMAQNQGKDEKGVRQDSGKSEQNRNAASSKDQQSQQSGQQGSQQHGGQHASGGTPALDDLGGKNKGESARDASQAFDQQNDADKKR